MKGLFFVQRLNGIVFDDDDKARCIFLITEDKQRCQLPTLLPLSCTCECEFVGHFGDCPVIKAINTRFSTIKFTGGVIECSDSTKENSKDAKTVDEYWKELKENILEHVDEDDDEYDGDELEPEE